MEPWLFRVHFPGGDLGGRNPHICRNSTDSRELLIRAIPWKNALEIYNHTLEIQSDTVSWTFEGIHKNMSTSVLEHW